MLNGFVQQVINEMRSHPFTLLLVLGLVAAASWGYANYAKASEITSVKEEVAALSASVSANNDKVDRVFKLQLSESIRSVHEQLCRTEDRRTRSNLQNTLDAMQEDYRVLNDGQLYPLGVCETLN